MGRVAKAIRSAHPAGAAALAAVVALSGMGCVYVMYPREFRPAEIQIAGLESSRYSKTTVWVLDRQLAYEVSMALSEGSFPVERLKSPVETSVGSSGDLVAIADGYSLSACEARPLGIPTSRNKPRPMTLVVVVIRPDDSSDYSVVEVQDARHVNRYSVTVKDGVVEVLEVISGHPTITVDRGRAEDRIRVQMSRSSGFDS